MRHLPRITTAAGFAVALLAARVGQASLLDFHIDVDTSALAAAGTPPKPFALDFQLTGGTPQADSATIKHFTFGGGAATSNPSISLTGSASGDLTSSVNLQVDNTTFFSEFFQGFTPGSTLGFDVTLSLDGNTPIPDTFSFAILDNSLANLATTDSSGGDTLVRVDILTGATDLGSVRGFSGQDPFTGLTVTVVPESSTVMAGGFVALLGAARLAMARRRARQAANVS